MRSVWAESTDRRAECLLAVLFSILKKDGLSANLHKSKSLTIKL